MDLNKILDVSKDYKLSLIEFFEISGDAFLVLNEDFRIIYVNPQTENFLSTEKKEIIGKVLWDVSPSSKETLISEKYYKAINDGTPQFWEMFSRFASRWMEVGAYPLKNGNIVVNVRDITKKKHRELELEESGHLSRILFEKIDDVFMIIEFLYDEAGNINCYKFIKVNDMFEKHTGLKNDNLIGKTIKQIPPNDVFSWLMDCDEVNKIDKSKHFINFDKATKRWYDVFCFPYDSGKVGVLFRDITKKVQMGKALRRSKERYKAFMTACFDSVYQMSSDWGQMHILKKEVEVLTDTQNPDSNWMNKYVHPDDLSYVANEINKAILNKIVYDLEHRILKEDGSLGWVHSKAVPIINKDGDIVEWLGTVSDITLRKEFELRLIEKEKEYLEILDSSSLGAFIIDFEKKECHASETWKEILGLKNLNSKEIFLKSLRGVIHPEDANRIATFRTNSINEKKSRYNVEYRIKTVDSGYIWVLGQAKVLYNKEGKPVKVYGTHIDITDRKLAEDALKESKKKAQKLIIRLRKKDTYKDNFISILSHELRNPLAVITMALSLIEHVTSGSEQNVRMGEIIKRQTTQLIRLVDDILDVTRIKRNKIELIKESIEVNGIVKEVLEEFKVQFNEKGVALEEEYYSDSMYINADSARIKQVIGNLLSNSLKFTEKDGIVKLTVYKDENTKDVVIRVFDTGIGIAPKLLSDLFEPFVQTDNSLARNAGSLGLGLPIVKGIIDLHGGSIVAKSEGLGKGSEFIIRFPLSYKIIKV